MRVAVLLVFRATTDIDISLVAAGQKAVEFAFLGPSVAGLLGDLYSSFNSFIAFNSFISFKFTSIGGLNL